MNWGKVMTDLRKQNMVSIFPLLERAAYVQALTTMQISYASLILCSGRKVRAGSEYCRKGGGLSKLESGGRLGFRVE